jgi:hypothetical protein
MATPKPEVPMIGIREFRDSFHSITTPVKVIRTRRPNIEVVGTWTPNRRRADLAKPEA